jgi:acylphosphatase
MFDSAGCGAIKYELAPKRGSATLLKKLAAVVSGRVQNVGYRMFARDMARRLAVTGVVRNNADGTVHVQAYGEEGNLQRFLQHLERGPHAARVERVAVTWGEAGDDVPALFEVAH